MSTTLSKQLYSLIWAMSRSKKYFLSVVFVVDACLFLYKYIMSFCTIPFEFIHLASSNTSLRLFPLLRGVCVGCHACMCNTACVQLWIYLWTWVRAPVRAIQALLFAFYFRLPFDILIFSFFFRSLLFIAYLINLPHGLLVWLWKPLRVFLATYMVPGAVINLPHDLLLWSWKIPSLFPARWLVPGTKYYQFMYSFLLRRPPKQLMLT